MKKIFFKKLSFILALVLLFLNFSINKNFAEELSSGDLNLNEITILSQLDNGNTLRAYLYTTTSSAITIKLKYSEDTYVEISKNELEKLYEYDNGVGKYNLYSDIPNNIDKTKDFIVTALIYDENDNLLSTKSQTIMASKIDKPISSDGSTVTIKTRTYTVKAFIYDENGNMLENQGWPLNFQLSNHWTLEGWSAWDTVKYNQYIIAGEDHSKTYGVYVDSSKKTHKRSSFIFSYRK